MRPSLVVFFWTCKVRARLTQSEATITFANIGLCHLARQWVYLRHFYLFASASQVSIAPTRRWQVFSNSHESTWPERVLVRWCGTVKGRVAQPSSSALRAFSIVQLAAFNVMLLVMMVTSYFLTLVGFIWILKMHIHGWNEELRAVGASAAAV